MVVKKTPLPKSKASGRQPSEAKPRSLHARRARAVSEASGPSIRLLHDEVLIQLIHPEQHSHGLWIPDSAKRSAAELWRGKVVAVGPGRRTKKGLRIVPDVEPGDRVGFFWRAGLVDVKKWPDDDHRIIHESDVMWKQVA
jgi:chaperonin GroES